MLEPSCLGPHDRLLADPSNERGRGITAWLRPGVDTSLLVSGTPVDVVVIGHFDDSLAEACPAATRQACRDVLVVEKVHPAPEAQVTNPRACGRRLDCEVGVVFGTIDGLPQPLEETELPLQTALTRQSESGAS